MKIGLASRHQKKVQIIDLIAQRCVFDLSFNPSNAPGAVLSDGLGGFHFLTSQKLYHLDFNKIENLNTNSAQIRLTRFLGRLLTRLGYSPRQLDSFSTSVKKKPIQRLGSSMFLQQHKKIQSKINSGNLFINLLLL